MPDTVPFKMRPCCLDTNRWSGVEGTQGGRERRHGDRMLAHHCWRLSAFVQARRTAALSCHPDRRPDRASRSSRRAQSSAGGQAGSPAAAGTASARYPAPGLPTRRQASAVRGDHASGLIQSAPRATRPTGALPCGRFRAGAALGIWNWNG